MSCNFVSYDAQLVSSYLDLINRQFLPSILIICFSALLVADVIRSRARVSSSLRDQQRLRRDVKLALNMNFFMNLISYFFMNLIFMVLNTPTSVAYFFPNILSSDVLLLVTEYLGLMSYGVNLAYELWR